MEVDENAPDAPAGVRSNVRDRRRQLEGNEMWMTGRALVAKYNLPNEMQDTACRSFNGAAPKSGKRRSAFVGFQPFGGGDFIQFLHTGPERGGHWVLLCR